MKFRLIADQREMFPVRAMCDVMDVSPAGYYAWRGRPESPRKTANRALLTGIRRVDMAHHRRYGAPRIDAALPAEGHTASRGRVERLMRHHGIRTITPRRFRACTPDSHHDLPIAANRLDQKFAAGGGPIRFGLHHLRANRGRVALSGRRARSPYQEDR
jgi:putative transposase